jgi:hypothetical protein
MVITQAEYPVMPAGWKLGACAESATPGQADVGANSHRRETRARSRATGLVHTIAHALPASAPSVVQQGDAGRDYPYDPLSSSTSAAGHRIASNTGGDKHFRVNSSTDDRDRRSFGHRYRALGQRRSMYRRRPRPRGSDRGDRSRETRHAGLGPLPGRRRIHLFPKVHPAPSGSDDAGAACVAGGIRCTCSSPVERERSATTPFPP